MLRILIAEKFPMCMYYVYVLCCRVKVIATTKMGEMIL